MAPAPTYALPPVQMRVLAADARRRGLDFEAFWHEAVRPGKKQGRITTAHPDPPAGAVRWPSEWSEGTMWRGVIESTKDGWRRAYEREAALSMESALRTCGDLVDAISTVAAEVTDDMLAAA